jgi:hypothetical protein
VSSPCMNLSGWRKRLPPDDADYFFIALSEIKKGSPSNAPFL